MKYLSSWLGEHIIGELPEKKILTETLSLKALEVEEIVDFTDGEYLLDVKILPHRQSDCLSHRGLAREICSLFGLSRKKVSPQTIINSKNSTAFSVVVEDFVRCPRYIGVLIEGVVVKSVSEKIKKRLEMIGQRSISNVVDITNFVMNDIGQPMHAFDASKIIGNITVRISRPNEKMTTLDGKDIVLTGVETVIADEEGVLALAGVKGGMKAVVDEHTTRIILESANFNPSLTRRSSDIHSIRTDASKRYEAGLTSEFAEEAMNIAVSLLLESCPEANISGMVDTYKEKENQHEVKVSVSEINKLLGSTYNKEDVKDIFKRENFLFTEDEDTYKVIIPFERLDIRAKVDLIEEVGRIMGYDSLSAVLPKLGHVGLQHKRLYYETKIKNILFESGFSEMYTYTFGDKGDVEILKAVSDKNKLRRNLADGVSDALKMNLHNAPLLGIKTVKVFEFGNVFFGMDEERHFSFAIDDGAKKSFFTSEGDFIFNKIKKEIGIENIDYKIVDTKPYIVEINLDSLLASLPLPTKNAILIPEIKSSGDNAKYKTVSSYPFIVRDIAVWVPKEVTFEMVKKGVEEALVADFRLLARPVELFDSFTKNDRTSYAFRLVIQSNEKTLTDEEANVVADKVYSMLKENNYEIR